MMEKPYLIGIDLGTSGVRATAYDMDGVAVDTGESPVRRQFQGDWEEALKRAVPDLPKGEKICSVDSTSGTVILADAKGRMVFPPQMYYESAPEEAEKIGKFDSARGIKEKGISISATSPLPKILRLRKERQGKFKEAKWILNPTTWLLYRLKYKKGKRWRDLETDWTNALKFGADITKDDPTWYEPLFHDAGISLDLMPRIRRPGTPIGPAESLFSEELGLKGADLYQGLTDGNASALAMGCLEPGDYGISCGSTSIVKYVSEEIRPHDAVYYHRHPIKGYFPGAAFETGVILRWFCEKILEKSQEEGLEMARKVKHGEEYGFFPQGNRSPFFNSKLGNTFLGIWPDQDLSKEEAREKLVRAIATGIAMQEYIYIPMLENLFDTTINCVHLLGGGTLTEEDPFDWWNQLRASIWSRKVVKMEPRTTVGSLIPAALSASLFDDVSEASKRLLREEGEIEIDEEVANSYMGSRKKFFSLWDEIRSFYDKSHKIEA